MIDSDPIGLITSHPLFRLSGEAMLLLDTHGHILKINAECGRLTGYDFRALNLRPFASMLSADAAEAFAGYFPRALRGDTLQGELEFRHRSGHTLSIMLRLIPVCGQEERFVYLIMKDITEQKLASRLIEHMAYHDTLTGLPNRTLFQIQLTQTLAAAGNESPPAPFAIMLVSLDRFPIINESLGLSWGDLLLKQVSERLQRRIGRADLICRLGNHEFALLYKTDADPDFIMEEARIIHEKLMVPYAVYDRELTIPGNIGIAHYPRDGTDMNSLIRHAAKVQTKEREKGQRLYRHTRDELMNDPLQRLELEHDLRKALEREEFELYYQPQYDIRNNRLIGMEALIRWNHPKHGMISPVQFIPLAEETGLIVAIGEWVLRTACSQNKRWQDSGLPTLIVSVNLSLRQFQKHNLVGDILGILRESGLKPHYLELEITESMAMDNVDRVIRKLNELKYWGIRISMDDFGTGYSSLHYLRKIPLHKLKIDQSFIRDLSTDPDSAAIVSTIIAMANHLKLEVVAEGVETEEDLRFLLQQNCAHGQGYFFSRPLPIGEFERLLHRERAGIR
ncbi:EAL domain-containing protein [Paenibacillus doosanensis]|uniref:Phytochrome-like protein cph2 n=1 Tax=Paenibacillus konkukensis TaxID=2020716 RepID=A0ABY4RIX3_9BACL|nr:MULTISPECIES: GGDEF domain-containing phosphodiesterase [Paenibacillus]MCS7461063.1 EAL domain-containing protein [Paenibacillus doosanensis]UQZ81559.1 Phytochrome-like protein cph2 [Paenibacillus konkukensis]